jgi:hypothetical protein
MAPYSRMRYIYIYPWLSIALGAKFAYDVLELFYAVPVFSSDAWLRLTRVGMPILFWSSFAVFWFYRGERVFKILLRPWARLLDCKGPRDDDVVARVHRDNSWRPAFLSGTMPCNATYLPDLAESLTKTHLSLVTSASSVWFRGQHHPSPEYLVQYHSTRKRLLWLNLVGIQKSQSGQIFYKQL